MNYKNYNINRLSQVLCVITLLILLLSLQTGMASEDEVKPQNESVGVFIFIIGRVYVINEGGIIKRAKRGYKLYQGDVIKTEKRGQGQVRFIDGAKISVRENSRLKVKAYVYDKNNMKSEFKLLEGGIRSITGAIGRANKQSYKLQTVVATIGIRGTDYSVMMCNQDCANRGEGNTLNGLYVGVTQGGVAITNDGGELNLGVNEYAMVDSIAIKPIQIPNPPKFLMFDRLAASKSERKQVAKSFEQSKNIRSKKQKDKIVKTATVESSTPVSNQTTENIVLPESSEVSEDSIALLEVGDVLLDTPADVNSLISANSESNVSVDNDNQDNSYTITKLRRFFQLGFESNAGMIFVFPQNIENTNQVSSFYQTNSLADEVEGYTTYEQGTSVLNDFGYDAETGLSWGRWSDGNVVETIKTLNEETTHSVDLSNRSMHWILGQDGSNTVQLPITGTKSYSLIGNTQPTDNFGNVGILGSANLTANFDKQTVDADVNVSINEQVWHGSQANIPIDSQSSSFSTSELSVDVVESNNSISGSGTLQGGFVDSGDVSGAGVTYNMQATSENGGTTNVTGAAIFQEAP